MARVTKSMTQGLKMLGGANVTNYTLYFLNPTKKHQAGKHETIVVPYIELGRASSCVVQYDDNASTVSRKHAAIEMQKGQTIIKNLSETNPTLVNGKPVKKQWFLKNGDEIQLSYEGPKLRYNTTATKTSTIGFTKRMQMFAGQALKPYKYAVATITILLIATATVSAIYIKDLQEEAVLAQAKIDELRKKGEENVAALNNALGIRDSIINEMGEDIDQAVAQARREARRGKALERRIAEINRRSEEERQRLMEEMQKMPKPTDENAASAIPDDDIFLLRVKSVVVQLPDGRSVPKDLRWTCTGFLCDDGKFITARHCIQSWRFSPSSEEAAINYLEYKGAQIIVEFIAISPSGKQINFTYAQSVYDDSGDIAKNYSGDTLRVNRDWSKDWAYVKTNQTGSIKFDKQLSKTLEAGEDLFFKGYSHGTRFQTDGIRPLYSESKVAQNGLVQGMINISNRSFEPGNSGGPAFVKKNDQYVAVGIVSNGPAGSNVGACVPVGNINR